MRILVVEDSRDMRELLAKLLRTLGHEVIRAVSGEVALEILEAGYEFELMITDNQMAKISGVELTKRILAIGYRIGTIMLYSSDDLTVEGKNLRKAYPHRPIYFVHKKDTIDKMVDVLVRESKRGKGD